MIYYSILIDSPVRYTNATFEIPNVSKLALAYFWMSVVADDGAGLYLPCSGRAEVHNSTTMTEVATDLAIGLGGSTIVFNGEHVFCNNLLPWVGMLPLKTGVVFDLDLFAFPEVAGAIHFEFVIQFGFEVYYSS